MAFTDTFKSAVVVCCLFHYKQTIRRNMTQKGCFEVFNNCENFRTLVGYLYGLPFVPKDEIIRVWTNVIKLMKDPWEEEWMNEGFSDEVDHFFRYYEKTFIGIPTRSMDGSVLDLVGKLQCSQLHFGTSMMTF